MWTGHSKEIRKLTFRALVFRRIRSDEGLTKKKKNDAEEEAEEEEEFSVLLTR